MVTAVTSILESHAKPLAMIIIYCYYYVLVAKTSVNTQSISIMKGKSYKIKVSWNKHDKLWWDYTCTIQAIPPSEASVMIMICQSTKKLVVVISEWKQRSNQIKRIEPKLQYRRLPHISKHFRKSSLAWHIVLSTAVATIQQQLNQSDEYWKW